MARVDYSNGPNAPKANSLVPSETTVARNDAGEVLLIHKTDNDLWALPQGGINLGESASDATVRETKEETGFDVEVRSRQHLHQPPARHGVGPRRGLSAVLHLLPRPHHRRPAADEQREHTFVDPRKLDELDIHPSMRMRIEHGLADRAEPYIG
ncbi:NUDIX domain-containing protein [Streptomyces griseoluteus]|uniref:NUDIX hydrolase n=1 Tax=Streptomyces griseoluteus TaxID=29306 RepID=UPI0036B8295C